MDLLQTSTKSPTEVLLQPADIIAEFRMAFDEQNGEMEASDAQKFIEKLSRISAASFTPPALEDVEKVSSWGTLYAIDGETLLLALLASPSLPVPLLPSESTPSTPASMAVISQGSSTSDAPSNYQCTTDSSTSECNATPTPTASTQEHVSENSIAVDPIYSRALQILNDALDEAGGQLEPVELLDVFRRAVAVCDSSDQQSRFQVPTITDLEDCATWGSIHGIDCQDLLRAAFVV